jgi:hypothetical protein
MFCLRYEVRLYVRKRGLSPHANPDRVSGCVNIDTQLLSAI